VPGDLAAMHFKLGKLDGQTQHSPPLQLHKEKRWNGPARDT